MYSPVRKIRQSFNLNQICMANCAGVSQTHISEVENGYSDLGAKLEEFLAEAGFGVDKIKKEHAAFMEEVAKKAMEQVLSAGK